MPKTVPDNVIGKSNLGYGLLSLLSKNASKQVAELLKKLSEDLPGAIWPMPPEQLHITLCEIVQPKEYVQDKELLFETYRKEYLDVPAHILSSVPKFTVTFDTIEASSHAIIIRAGDSSQLNDIRAQLTANFKLPEETRTPPDITHSSIARYRKEVELEKVQAITAGYKIFIKEEMSNFVLVRNTLPPLQEYEVLRAYPLADSRH